MRSGSTHLWFKRFLFLSTCALIAIVFGTPRPVAAAPSGKTWTLYILGGGTLLYEGAKLLIDDGNADADRKKANDSVDFKIAATNATKDTISWSKAQSWNDLRSALLYAIANPEIEPSTSVPIAEPKPAGDTKSDHATTYRDLIDVVTTCANMWIYAKPDPKNNIDCVKPASDLGIDTIDAKDAFAKTDPMEVQIVNASLKTYQMQNELRRDIVKLMAVRLIQQLRPFKGDDATTPREFLSETYNAAASATDFFSDCVVTSTLSTPKCITDIGNAETGAATAHRAKVACVFAASYWVPPYTALHELKSKSVTIHQASSTHEVPGSDLPYPIALDTTDFGPVPGC